MTEYDNTPGLNAEGPAKRPESTRQNQKRQSGSQQGRASGPSQETRQEPVAETLVKTEVSEPQITEKETTAETFPVPEQIPEIMVAGKTDDGEDDDSGEWQKVTGPVVSETQVKENDLKITVGGDQAVGNVSSEGLLGAVSLKPVEMPPVENSPGGDGAKPKETPWPAGPFNTCHDFVMASIAAGCDDRGYAYPIVRAAFEAGQKSILLRNKSLLKPAPKF